MELTCPTCRQRSRHPPSQMLGHWAICPHCGGEIDWRRVTPPIGVRHDPTNEVSVATPNDEEN